MKNIKANLEYFVKSSIFTIASEDGEYVDITYMAEEALKSLNKLEVIEEKFQKLVKECLIEAGFREQEPHPTVKECVEVLANWKDIK